MPERPRGRSSNRPSPKARECGESETRAMFNEQFDQARVVGENIHGPRPNVMLHPLVEVFDLERHRRMLANTRTQINTLPMTLNV